MKKSLRICGLILVILVVSAVISLSVYNRTYSTSGILRMNGEKSDVTATVSINWLGAKLFHKANGSLSLIDNSGNCIVDYALSGIIIFNFRDTVHYAAVSVYDAEENRYIPLELYYDDNMDYLNIKTGRFEFLSEND